LRSRGGRTGDMGAALPAITLGASATSVAAGLHHTCALLTTGAVKCWGLGAEGELGRGDTATIGDAAGEVGPSLAAVALGGTAAGGDAPGEMGANLPAVNLGASPAVELAIGGAGFHTCATLANGAMKCWGAGFSGQLGQGDTVDRGASAGTMGSALAPIDLRGE